MSDLDLLNYYETKLGSGSFSYAHIADEMFGDESIKMMEMWKNYRPSVPEKYQCDTLYAKPDVNVMVKVKDEKGLKIGIW